MDWNELDITRILAVVVLLSAVAVVYIGLTATATSASYTEFYVLNPDGEASDYPTTLSVGESGTVLVGLTNHEGERTAYTVVLRFSQERVAVRSVTVRDEGRWARNFSFTPRTSGTKRLRILLYDGDPLYGSTAPKELQLWIDVRNTTAG